ncbi:CXXC zinc finger domain protein [Aphelenchoides besseyi]|nr:CXXC zinc finger domain protein [Aphelenchoides besseyi]KAI6193208.1 CXXC zinc finger domain protein [Aphelenchoides besseyi]
MTAAAVPKETQQTTSAPTSPSKTPQKSPINALDLSPQHQPPPSTSSVELKPEATTSSQQSKSTEVEQTPDYYELKPMNQKPTGSAAPQQHSAVVSALQSNSTQYFIQPGHHQQLPMSTAATVTSNGIPGNGVLNSTAGHVAAGPFPNFGHLLAAQNQLPKPSPNFQFPPHPHSAVHPNGAGNFFGMPPHSAPPHPAVHQSPAFAAADHDASSPKRSDSALLNSMCNRSQRCGICKGCTNQACGECPFCLDSPQFGGPGVKKQSCLERRCHRVLENKLQRDAPSFRARRGCGTCEDCRQADCNTCLVCFDRKHFKNSYIPGAMCARKRCNHAVVMDNSSRMKKRVNGGDQSGVAYPKPAKRPSPSDFPGMPTGLPLGMSPTMQNRNGQINGGMMMPQSVLHSSPANLHNRLPALGTQPNENRPGFHPAGMYGDFSTSNFAPSFQTDPNANRVPGFHGALTGSAGPCIVPLPNGQFINSTHPFPYLFPQPLQPTQVVTGNGGKDAIKSGDQSPSGVHDDPFQPPSYKEETSGSVVLQAL